MKRQNPGPDTWKLFRIWAGIGLQSFGGGASTTFLIQRAFIDKYEWITIEEFTSFWNLCVFTPGINLIALTVLIGRKLGGARGIAASLILKKTWLTGNKLFYASLSRRFSNHFLILASFP